MTEANVAINDISAYLSYLEYPHSLGRDVPTVTLVQNNQTFDQEQNTKTNTHQRAESLESPSRSTDNKEKITNEEKSHTVVKPKTHVNSNDTIASNWIKKHHSNKSPLNVFVFISKNDDEHKFFESVANAIRKFFLKKNR